MVATDSDRDGSARLYRDIGSRPFSLLLSLLACLCLVTAIVTGHAARIYTDFGLLLPTPSVGVSGGLLSGIVALLLLGGAVALLITLNKNYNLHRSLSQTWIALFLLGCASVPSATCSFGTGLLLLPVMLLCIWIMFDSYQQTDKTRSVYLMFCMVSAGGVADYGFLPYLVVLYVGMAQMRIVSLRTVLASLAGILTPVWILYAYGIVDIDTVRLPEVVNILHGSDVSDTAGVLSSTVVTAVAWLLSSGVNLLDIYSRNARTRAFNGLITVTGFVTGLMCAVDFGHLLFYLPLLLASTAYQMGLLYSLRRKGRPYIAVLVLAIVYIALYIRILCV